MTEAKKTGEVQRRLEEKEATGGKGKEEENETLNVKIKYEGKKISEIESKPELEKKTPEPKVKPEVKYAEVKTTTKDNKISTLKKRKQQK